MTGPSKSVRISGSQWEALRALADSNHRPISMELFLAIEAHLKGAAK